MRLAMILVCALSLASCRRAPAPMPDLFTEVAGAWHRTSVRELPSSLPPDFVPPAAIERIRAASYEGPGKLDARVYQLTSPAVALDVVQRWRPVPGTVFFYSFGTLTPNSGRGVTPDGAAPLAPIPVGAAAALSHCPVARFNVTLPPNRCSGRGKKLCSA